MRKNLQKTIGWWLVGLLLFGVNVMLVVLLRNYFVSVRRHMPLCHIYIHNNCRPAVSNAFPNVRGRSVESMETFLVEPYLQKYSYVPGLKADDPGELVLFYLKERTGNLSHGYSTFLSRLRHRWIIIGPDFDGCEPRRGRGEMCESVDTPEFKARLQRTLHFLQENNRPYWTNAVAEHTAFLNSIKE